MAQGTLEALIKFDREFAVRYTDLVNIIRDWTQEHIRFEEADILDFGCGEGLSALGFANRLNARSVTAVDIGLDVHHCAARSMENLGRGMPPNLDVRLIEPGENFLPGKKFDLIYSWSVFEHIDQTIIDPVIEQLRSRLKPGGLLFTQIAPLFYSSQGSHMTHKYPLMWGHLLLQDDLFLDRLKASCDSQAEFIALLPCFHTLNRLTVPELKRRLERPGLSLLREYTSRDVVEPPPELLEIFNREVLTTNQVVLLHRYE